MSNTMHITNHSSRSQKTPFFVPSELNRYVSEKNKYNRNVNGRRNGI